MAYKVSVPKEKFQTREILKKLREELQFAGKYQVFTDKNENIVVSTTFWTLKIKFRESEDGQYYRTKLSTLRIHWTTAGFLLMLILIVAFFIPAIIFSASVKSNIKRLTPIIKRVLVEDFDAIEE